MGEFRKYNLSQTQLTKIARLCVQEQGSKGAPYEASLMCNLYELHGSNYSTLYDYVRNCGWFYKAAYYMDNGSASASVVEAVEKVINEGKRLLPRYIDEHDCFTDISWVKNNGIEFTKTDRNRYIPNVTVVKNRMGSLYTFYTFPTPSSDPFGYTDNKYAPKEKTNRTIMCIGNSVNFRKGAGTEYDVITQLDEGETLVQVGTSGAWTKAEYKGNTGYIYTKYVCDLEQVANNILSNLRTTYSTAELRTLLETMEKLVN